MSIKSTLFLLTILLTVTALLGVVRHVPRAHAAQYFGGMRTGMFTCSCSGSTLIYVNDYVGGGSLALVYNGSGRLFSNNNIFGTYLLGSYSPGGQCLYYVGEACEEMESDGSFDSNPGTGTS